MKYFSLDSDLRLQKKGVLANLPTDSDWLKLPWSAAVKFEQRVTTPIIYSIKKKSKMKNLEIECLDYIYAFIGSMLVSKRFLHIIKKINKNIDSYRSKIQYGEKYLDSEYFSINLLELYPAMNMRLSKYDSMQVKEKQIVIFAEELILSQKKIDQIPKGEHLFRLQECPSYIIISEYGKNLIEENGIIGVEFEPLKIAD